MTAMMENKRLTHCLRLRTRSAPPFATPSVSSSMSVNEMFRLWAISLNLRTWMLRKGGDFCFCTRLTDASSCARVRCEQSFVGRHASGAVRQGAREGLLFFKLQVLLCRGARRRHQF
jgi:hypothetical protein